MQVFNQIDYIKFKSDTPLFDIYDYEPSAGNFKYKSVTPHGTVYFGHNKSAKYSHVLSGQDCEFYRQLGETDEAFIERCISIGAEFTRVDLAITIEGDILTEFKQHAPYATGALPESNIHKAISEGITDKLETYYIGDKSKRAKKGIFRAYDYTLKHDIGVDLKRLELEIGSARAMPAMRKFNMGTSIGALMNDYIQFPTWELWKELTSGEVYSPMRGKSSSDTKQDELASRWQWLHTQVASSLGKAMAQSTMAYGNMNEYNEFMSIAKQSYEDELKRLNSFTD